MHAKKPCAHRNHSGEESRLCRCDRRMGACYDFIEVLFHLKLVLRELFGSDVMEEAVLE